MLNNKNICVPILLFVLFFSIFGNFCLAETNNDNPRSRDVIFKAKVLAVLEEKEKETEDGRNVRQQNLKLLGLEKEFKNKEIIFEGIGNIEIVGEKLYKEGEKLLILASFNSIDNSYTYYVYDYLRSGPLFFMVGFFLLILFLVGKWKGLRAVFSLFFTFLIIILYIVPKILDGADPVFVTLLGSFFILFFIIYMTEGFNAKSHIAALSTFISLLLVAAVSWLFIYFGKLSGAFNEDVFILLNIGQNVVNFKGLLLAGIIIGTLGVVDDVIISQVATAEQIIESNPHQGWQEVFKKSYKVGISHISSMTNTLFLAYAGASLPLLILFISPENPFSSFEQIISNEAISTEIIRALSGSIGIVLSVPLSTFLASWWFVRQKRKT
ncbi:hypothetical protein CVU82_04175 [Candidatus Falkowbacteria bacterium HGW-Falkowbacteria-1]|uniref:YibE/F family protein n=1 Tax=Candidatus Falkowbacteria bacterium HGW-Falkowbacteria-1 TaxID=2013768 RepID=A0A2N2E960_9BACT|nr:MAG: hypothetical protein CVU82_04175 [Candidatus Falkowbacteria bacterium HGW-Falkowbacteria-1]